VWHLAAVQIRKAGVIAALGLALAACGGSGDASESAPDSTSPPASSAASTAADATSPSVAGAVVSPAPATSAAANTVPVPYVERGPYPVGVVELTDGDVPITVFYPALDGSEEGQPAATYDLREWLPPEEAAKVAGFDDYAMSAYTGLPPADPDGGPYPLVLFSHGLAGYRLQSTFLTTHLASWGFVVAAVEHPYRNLTAVFGDLAAFAGQIGTDDSPDVGQLLGAIDVVQAASTASTGPLAGLAVDTTRVGAVGHSLGGFAVFAAARDPRITSYVAFAFPVGGSFVEPTTPTTGGAAPPEKPALLIAGSADVIAPLPRVDAAYAALPTPKRLAILDGMTHLGFTDICELTGPGQPNVLDAASQAGVAVPPIVSAVFADGCDPKHTEARQVWPVLDALTTAHLRATLGIDDQLVGFDETELKASFPSLQITLSESP
jgi:predicted dienelactone hydrolase